jgi:2-dehydropantoate 2-reductase
MGAGSVGVYLGGKLSATGVQVHAIGRERLARDIRLHGLRLSDLEGVDQKVTPPRWHLLPDDPALPPPGLVLLTVKSGATAQAARQLSTVLAPGTPVLSFQNGVENLAAARQAAPQLHWLAGMVPFNIVELAPGHWHRASSGRLVAERDVRMQAWLAHFEAAGLPLWLQDDMAAVQWAKLLLNLNNPVNALSGLTLRDELLQSDWRWVLAALMEEALALLHAARQPVARLSPLPPHWVPAVLRLPTPLFRLVAARMLRLDPKARSSMADDLALGRPLEMDALCGAVVRLAGRLETDAPRNAAMLSLLQHLPATQDTAAWQALRRKALGLGLDRPSRSDQ